MRTPVSSWRSGVYIPELTCRNLRVACRSHSLRLTKRPTILSWAFWRSEGRTGLVAFAVLSAAATVRLPSASAAARFTASVRLLIMRLRCRPRLRSGTRFRRRAIGRGRTAFWRGTIFRSGTIRRSRVVLRYRTILRHRAIFRRGSILRHGAIFRRGARSAARTV